MTLKNTVRAKETTQTSGTGSYEMLGATGEFETLLAAAGNGIQLEYVCRDASDYEWGLGTIASGSPATLSRDVIFGSSNADAAVVWPASGTRDIFGAPLSGRRPVVTTSAASLTVAVSDCGALLRFTGSSACTVTLPAVASAGEGFELPWENAGTASLIFDGNAAETVGGAATFTATPGDGGVLIVSGGAWLVRGRAVGIRQLPVSAGGMVARTTNGAASGLTETTTNKLMVRTYDFDASTEEYVQFGIAMPKSWDSGTITAEFIWSADSGSGAVVWGLAGVAAGDDDALDAAFGTGGEVTDTLLAAGDDHRTAATSAITIAGTPARGDLVTFQVYRKAASGSDTLAVDARLLGVVLNCTFDRVTDA